MIESIVVLPILISVAVTVFLCISIFWLRISLNFITQEMAACSLSTQGVWQCQQKAQSNAQLLFEHWGFHHVQIQTFLTENKGTLQSKASWNFLGYPLLLQWTFQSKSLLQK